MSTKNKIILAAIDLFSEIPYDNVSILQICKNACISNGSIYKYFKNKEELFIYLMELISEKIEEKLSSLKGDSVEEKLKNYIELNLEITKDEKNLIKIFREGQYKFIEYEKRIKKAYLKTLEKVFGRKLSQAEIIYVLGSMRFINISYSYRNKIYNVDFLVKILLNGFTKEYIDLKKIYDINIYKKIILNSEGIKNKILSKGAELFGKYGFYDIKIKNITDQLNMAVGSFYNFFENKEIFFIKIIEDIKTEILEFLKDNFHKELTPGELHILFLNSYINFYKDQEFKCKLIRDTEFINLEIYLDFLNKIENFYIKTLDKTPYSESEKEVISNILLGIQHYMEIELFFTKELKIPEDFLNEISILFRTGVK